VYNLFRATHAWHRVMSEEGGVVGVYLMSPLLLNTDLGMLAHSAL